MVQLQQCGKSEKLEQIKAKVFGKRFDLPNAPLTALESNKKEKNLYTFIGMRKELVKDHVKVD